VSYSFPGCTKIKQEWEVREKNAGQKNGIELSTEDNEVTEGRQNHWGRIITAG
jgi:hypothetical protein